MAVIRLPYCFGSPGVKIILWGVKNVKILVIACVQAVVHGFFQIYFIFSACIDGYDVSPPYLFCWPGVKIKRVIAILSPGVKIILWGVENIKHFNL